PGPARRPRVHRPRHPPGVRRPPRRLHGLGRRDRGPGPCGRYPVGQEGRDLKLLHAARTDQAERRDPGGPGPGARYEGKPARPSRRGAEGLGPARHHRRAVVEPEGSGGALTARLTGPQGSGILTSMARANALLIVPEDRPSVAAGETLAALLLDDPHHVAEAPF